MSVNCTNLKFITYTLLVVLLSAVINVGINSRLLSTLLIKCLGKCILTPLGFEEYFLVCHCLEGQ